MSFVVRQEFEAWLLGNFVCNFTRQSRVFLIYDIVLISWDQCRIQTKERDRIKHCRGIRDTIYGSGDKAAVFYVNIILVWKITKTQLNTCLYSI